MRGVALKLSMAVMAVASVAAAFAPVRRSRSPSAEVAAPEPQQRRWRYDPNAPYDGRFTFARIRYAEYYSTGWAFDYPTMERNLMLMVDVFHHIEDRGAYFRKLRGSLNPGGRIAIIDFRLDSPEGPPKAARIAPERVTAELEGAGYKLAAQHGFLPNQYFLVFTPEGNRS